MSGFDVGKQAGADQTAGTTGQAAAPGKSTYSGLLDTYDERNDPARRPPQYAAMDQAMVDLLFRSKDEYFKGSIAPFWDCVDKHMRVKHLQTLTQVISGARSVGLLPSIVTLLDVHDYGSSWGINFKGPSVLPIATNGHWGKDWPQDAVRAEHYHTAHDWYRQDSGPGNPGMHLGVDGGAGYNNVHWDPTNPMERVSTGQISGSPFLAKMPGLNDLIPKGHAIYSPKALIQHEADIGKTDKVPLIGKQLTAALKGSPKAPTAHSSTEPFFSITSAQDLTVHGRDWARWENERKGEWVDKSRAATAVSVVNAACQGIEQLEIDARPLALQERKPENEAALADLARRLDAAVAGLFRALAAFIRHLHAEAPGYPAHLGGFESESDWKPPIWPQWELVAGLQAERAKRKSAP